MTVPHYVSEHTSEIRTIKSGGAMASSRPVRIQTRGNASPESFRRGAIFEHRPGCGRQWRRTRPAVHSRRMNVGGNIGFQAVSN